MRQLIVLFTILALANAKASLFGIAALGLTKAGNTLYELTEKVLPTPVVSLNARYSHSFNPLALGSERYAIINKYSNTLDSSYVHQIFNEFATIYTNGEPTTLRNIKLNFWIDNNVGTVKLVQLQMSGDKQQITFKGKMIQSSVSIPDVFRDHTECSRTGDRRYIIAGPREKECYTHVVRRDPNMGEVKMISNVLTTAILNSAEANTP